MNKKHLLVSALLVFCCDVAQAYETAATGSFLGTVVPGGQAIPTDLLELELPGTFAIGDLIKVEGYVMLDKYDEAGDTLALIRTTLSGKAVYAGSTIDLEDRRYLAV